MLKVIHVGTVNFSVQEGQIAQIKKKKLLFMLIYGMKLLLSTRVFLSYHKPFGGIKCAVMRTNFNPSTRSRRGWRNAGLAADVLYLCRRVQFMSPYSCRIVSNSDLPCFRFRAPEIAGDIGFRCSLIQVLQNRKGSLGEKTRSFIPLRTIRRGTLLLHT